MYSRYPGESEIGMDNWMLSARACEKVGGREMMT